MGFNVKTWGNPINITSNDLNRIEQGIKSSHDTLNVLQEEVGAVQLKTLDLTSKINSLISNAPDVLSTLNDLNDILIDNPAILDTLKNTDGLLSKGKQTLTIRELDQVYKNLKLDTFLHLTDVQVNGESIVNGSIIDIPSPKIDKYLNGSSNNAISNSAVSKALEDIKKSLGEIVVEESDPTVPSWAKSPVKPLYYYSEILNTPVVPSKLSDLLNDADYATNTRVTTIYNDLNNALDEKALISHKHSKLDILDFSHMHLKSDITDFSHTHSSADIPDIQDIINTSMDNLKINLGQTYLPLTAGSTKPLTGMLYANAGAKIGSGSYLEFANEAQFIIPNRIIKFGSSSSYKSNLLTMTPSYFIPYGNGTALGNTSNQWREIHGLNIYQNGKQVANKTDLDSYLPKSGGTMTGTISYASGDMLGETENYNFIGNTAKNLYIRGKEVRPTYYYGLLPLKLALTADIPKSVDGMSGGTISGNLIVGGNLTVNGDTSIVNSTTLEVKDKLITVAKDNEVSLTSPAGLIVPKYDGTNYGALVFDNNGTAYVGDATLDSSGEVDIPNSDLQPLATRASTELMGETSGKLTYWDGSEHTIKTLADAPEGYELIGAGEGNVPIWKAINFAECSTDASAEEKHITIDNFKLIKGSVVHILFKNRNTANNVTLSINNSDSKKLKYQGITVSELNSWQEEEIIEFVYDGETWQSIGSSNTTSPVMSDPKIMLPLGMIFPAAFPLTDASVHLLDGSIISQAGMYSSFASYLKSLIANGTIQECTLDEYNLELETYGQCGKFVVDNDAGTIKLPYITEFIASNNGGQALALNELDTFKAHTHAQDGHTHNVSDQGHSHTVNTGKANVWFSAGKMYTDKGVGGSDSSTNNSGRNSSSTTVDPPYSTWPTVGDSGHSHGLSSNTTNISIKSSQPPIQETGSDKTQPRTIRLPYYIVLANHIEEEVTIDINQVAEDIKTTQAMINNFVGLPVGTIISAALPIYDPCVRLLDGSTLSQEGVYKQFSNYLHKVQESNPDLFISNSEYLDLVSDYGECGKFVLDDENKTIKLPMIKHFIQGTLDIETVGNITPAGLPNITGSIDGRPHTSGSEQYGGALTNARGVFTYARHGSTTSNNGVAESGTSSKDDRVSFDASNSSEVYGKSDTVQPQSILYPYYIVVSTGIETEVKISTDDIIEEFNKTKELLTTTSGLPIGMIISSAVEMDTATLRLLNGDCLSQIGIYNQFYSWITNKITNNPSSVPTCTLEEYASDVGMKGQCGKFVINSTATTQTTDLKNKVIRYQGYRLNSSNGTTAVSGQSVIFVPVKQGYFVTIKRTNAPTYDYLYETSSHGTSYTKTSGESYTFNTTQSRTIVTETSTYLAFTIDDTDWNTFEVFIGSEMMTVDPVSIKLPTITRFIEGLSSIEDLGKGLAAGLPNITGNFTLINVANAGHGATVRIGNSSNSLFSNTHDITSNNIYTDYDSSYGNGYEGIKFDASKGGSDPIYGKSNTVQPTAVKYPYYIVVSTRIEMDAAINFAEEIDNIYTANISDESVTAWRTKLGVSGSGSGGSGIASGVIIRRWE